MMTEKNHLPIHFRSYLLRLWLEGAPSQTQWRIVLINPRTGNRRGFADFGCLVEFLKEELPQEAAITSKDIHEPPV